MRKIKSRYILLAFLIFLPIPMVVVNIFSGSMPFWFDPARDFLSALDNQHKLTLIGQPTGIPGLFYGPYWIWLLSIALFISKDPRIVQFLVLGIPYLFIFPIVLYKFKDIFGVKIVSALWILFIFAFMRYAIFPWNPHFAPVLTLIIFYFLLFKNTSKKPLVYIFLAGLFSGLVGNFHISFDVGLVLGAVTYIVISNIEKINFKFIKKTITELTIYSFGFLIAFTPFVLFEIRHGFFQSKTVLSTLFNPYAVVGIKGLSMDQIINSFTGVPSQLFQSPNNYQDIVFALIVVSLVFVFLKKTKIERTEGNLLILAISVLAFVLLVFIKSKNPVWEYHFIAMEIPFLLIIGFIVKKVSIAKVALFAWVLILVVVNYFSFTTKPRPSVLSYDTLAKKEYIVNLIKTDAGSNAYTVFAYNPGIYTYDFSYLFRWLAQKEVPYDPSWVKVEGKLIYLIIQKSDPGIYQDFINHRAPDSKYKTGKMWKIEDGTTVIRRELKS